MGESISVAFAEMAALAARSGVSKINELPGCWERSVGDVGDWWFSVNGHDETIKNSRGQDVPPYSAAVYWGDWAAGIIDMHGGILAAGSAANEEAFIAALREAKGSHA